MDHDMAGAMGTGWWDVTAMILVLVAVIAALAVSVWAVERARRAERRAETLAKQLTETAR